MICKKGFNLIFKLIAVMLIQVFILGNYAWAGENSSMLSPVLSIDAKTLQNVFFMAQEKIEVEFEDIFLAGNAGLENLQNGFDENGRLGVWGQKIAGWLHNKFVKRFIRIKKILGFIMAGESASRKVFVATTMIVTNLTIDIYFTNIILKTAIIAGCVFSGNFFLIWLVMPLSLFLVGGIIRLIPAVFFRVIFINYVRLSLVGLLVNFVPWGVGNFAALLFVKGSEPQDLWIAKETRKLSRLIDRSVAKFADASKPEVSMVEKYSVEIAIAIQDCQIYLNDYTYRRFKIRGTKGYSEEKIRRVVTRENLSMKTPFVNNLQLRILSRAGIFPPGYRKGTRPILLFGNRESLTAIKEQMKNSGISREHLQRIYQFDMSGFYERMKDHEAINHFSSLEEVRSITQKFIKQMFSEQEIETVMEVTMNDNPDAAENQAIVVNTGQMGTRISQAQPPVSAYKLNPPLFILQSI